MNIINVILLIYVLLLITNNRLLTPRVRNFIQDCKFVQYTALFILIAIIVNYMERCNMQNMLIKSTLITIIIIALLKIDLDWSIIVIIVLIGGFLWNYKLDCVDKHIQNNFSLENNKKNILINNNNRRKHWYLIIVVIFILLGTSIYFMKKYNQYGNNFSIIKFINSTN